MNVQSIIGGKSPVVATITQTATLREAIDQLTERRIGALVVSGDGKAIEGIISERDIVRAASTSGPSALDGSVGSVMSTDVVTCSAGDGVDRLMALMTERRIRHLPVVDERGHLAGHRVDRRRRQGPALRARAREPRPRRVPHRPVVEPLTPQSPDFAEHREMAFLDQV